MRPFRIYLGWDPREAEAAAICAWSIRKHASIPVDVRFLKNDELVDEHGFRMNDRPATTAFAYSRFAVAWLCGYEGTALFADGADMLALADVAELARLPMDNFALRVVKHDYRPTATTKMDGQPQVLYPRKNWSSVMLLNCAKLPQWTKEAVETWSGQRLHRFEDIPDAQIGDLDPAWNSLDQVTGDTKLWHLTSGGPWFDACRNCSGANLWLAFRDLYRAELREAAGV